MQLLRSKRLRQIVPFIISFLLIVALVSYTPFGKVGEAYNRFNDSYIYLLIGLSMLYYLLKTVRFWYLLQAMGIHKPFKPVALSYMSAQPVSLLPGGEIYRSHALKHYTDVEIKDSLAQFTMQGFLEGLAMAVLAIISALALHTLRIPMLMLAAFVLFVTIVISRGYVKNVGDLLNKLPFINIASDTLMKLDDKQRAVLTRQWLPLLFGISIITELTGAAIAYVAVLGVGAHIDIYQAILLYVIPVVAGFISLLPGGVGISEQSAVGVLLLSHISVGDAIAATLVMRLAIVGLGVVYGFAIGAFGKIHLTRNPDKHEQYRAS